MKKIALVFMALVGALTVQAKDTYPYLTFETTDGAKVSVDVSQLTLSISGNTLTAGSQTFVLANLSKMYFSASDETTTDVEKIDDLQSVTDSSTEIYDLQGHKIAKTQMRKGAYIIKTKQGTYKIVVK